MFNIERHGIYLNGPTNVVVSNNYINGQTNDLERYSHWEGNMKINGVRNALVNDNILIGNYYGISIMSSFSENGFCGQNIKIENNTIKNCIRNSGFGFGSISIPETGILKDVSIINNTIENELSDDKSVLRGISIERYSSTGVDYSFNNVTVSNNHIKGLKTGIRIALKEPIMFGNGVVSGYYEIGIDSIKSSQEIIINDVKK